MRWRRVLPIIGIALFIYILIRIDILKVFEEIASADYGFLLLALVLTLPLFLLQTLKWHVIALRQGIGVGYWEAFKINMASHFYGFVTPSKIGAVIRADYLKKYTGNVGKGVSNYAIDKILDIVSVFFIAILFSFIFSEKLAVVPKYYLVGVLVLIVVVGLVFSRKERARFLLRGFFNRFVPERLKDKARLSFEGFYEHLPGKRWLFLFFILNVINWIVIYFVAFIIGLGLGIELHFIYYLAVMPIGTVVGLIPITINGLGTREAALISLFGLFGIGAAKVFSLSIINLFITGVIPALLASFLIFGFRE